MEPLHTRHTSRKNALARDIALGGPCAEDIRGVDAAARLPYRDRTFPFGKERPFGNLGAVMRRWMAFLLICTGGAEAFPAQSISRAGALKVLPSQERLTA